MRSRWLVVAGLVALVAGTAAARPTGRQTPPAPAPAAAPAADTDPPVPGAGSALGDAPTGSDGPDGDGSAATDPFDGLPHIAGPALVDLGHGAEIDLAPGLVLFERATAQDLVRQGGNSADGVVAMIVGAGSWTVVIEAADVGYVSDADAEELDAGALLEAFRTGTITQNRERVRLGVPELFIDGWSEAPRYDRAAHHLIWGLNGHDSDGKVVNFFTRFLGRAGYLSVNLIDDPATIEASKVEAMAILSALRFKGGSRYTDHAEGDKDSGIGLTALVVGGTAAVAAKKTGILIAILIFLKKGFVVVLAAIAGFVRWMMGRPKKAALPRDPQGPPDLDAHPGT